MQKQQPFCQYEPIPLPKEMPILINRSRLRQAIPEERGSPPHRHNTLEIGLCHTGYGVFSIDTKILPFHEGDIAIIGPAEAHYARSAPGVISEWTWIFLDPVGIIGSLYHNPELLAISQIRGDSFCNIISPLQRPRLRDYVKLLIETFNTSSKYKTDQIRGIVLSLLAVIQELPGIPASSTLSSSPERILPAIHYIHQFYHQKVSVTKLARLCYMSPSGFREYFRKVMKCSPLSYLQRYRITMACTELLQTQKTLEEIANGNGFPTVSSFLRQFQKIHGTSPRQWSRQQLGTGRGME